MSNRTRVIRIMLKFSGCWATAFALASIAGNYINSAVINGVLGVFIALVACVVAAIWSEKERYP